MKDNISAIADSAEFGFKYFYELTVGTVLITIIGFFSWVSMKLIKHGERIATLEAERITRADFERWREEQQMQMDELRASSIASGKQAVEVVRESQAKLEAQLTRGLDKVDETQRQLLIILAKNGLSKGD